MWLRVRALALGLFFTNEKEPEAEDIGLERGDSAAINVLPVLVSAPFDSSSSLEHPARTCTRGSPPE